MMKKQLSMLKYLGPVTFAFGTQKKSLKDGVNKIKVSLVVNQAQKDRGCLKGNAGPSGQLADWAK